MATKLIKTSRISFDESVMLMCHAVAARSTCRHREQGAIVIKNKRVISCGYNGAPPGEKDCLECGYCSKEEGGPCRAEGLHGESNAIISAARAGVSVDGSIIYAIYSPCFPCCNMIKTAGITEVVYEQEYDGYPGGPGYLKALGVEVRKLEAASD